VFARYTTVQGEPDKIDVTMYRIDGEIRAAVESIPGNLGFAVLADTKGNRLIGASYWDSAESLRASEQPLAPAREVAAATAGGQASFETFEVAVAFRRTIPSRGAVVRLSRWVIDPARVEDGIMLTQEEILPPVKGANGLCSFVQLVDRESGAGITVTTWENQAAAEAFASVAEHLRTRASDRVGIRIDQPETWTMIRTTARLD
jgi:heme-degrading monooxygenase HmoA